MARVKKCEEEFNPWPPFVDVFSSVILVLLLFILVTIVNVAYYMQFNSKSESEAKESSAKVDSLNKGQDVTDMISLKKEKKVAFDSKGNDSLFTGGTSEGNAMTIPQKEAKVDQRVDAKGDEIVIGYENQEIYLSKSARAKLKSFIQKIRAKNPNAKFEISIARPTNMLGETIPKQIAIGRALSTKNAMKKMGVKLSQMKLNITKTKVDKSKNKQRFGYVKIKVIH